MKSDEINLIKIKEYLSKINTTTQISTDKDANITIKKGLWGKELSKIKDKFEEFEEFQGKDIKIIYRFKYTKDGPHPNLVTINIKDFKKLSDNIKLYSIYFLEDDLFINCSEDDLVR